MLARLRKLIYNRETGVEINRFTLHIGDKEMAQDVRSNQLKEFNDFYYFANLAAAINLL